MSVATSADDYIELLPATWRAINAYGIKISHRVYDSPDLSPLRGQRSGITASKDLWEVHRDPYDVSRVWVRNHWDGGWILAFWKHLSSSPAPFGELAWDHSRRQLTAAGADISEQQISDAVSGLLARARAGPPSPAGDTGKPTPRERRVAARTKATAPEHWPEPAQQAESAGPDPAGPAENEPGPGMAEVIPLGVFDASKEARQWW